jgi:ATP-dependent Clp endopeptidase proteolytic subunit ClpP
MTKIMIYGEIGDSVAALDAGSIVSIIGSTEDTLEIHINSGGGNVVEGLAIFNALQRAKDSGRTVRVYIDGLAASMASVLACAGDEILMAENALIMIHNPWDGCWGDAADLRAHADRLDLLRDQIVGIYAKRTGMPIDALQALMDAETWFDAETAMASNFVTGVMVATYAVNSLDLSKFGYRKVPVHPLVAVSAAASNPQPAAAGIPKGETPMADQVTPAAPGNLAPAAPAVSVEAVTASVTSAVSAERSRIAGINALANQHKIDSAVAQAMIDEGISIETARAKVLDVLATRTDSVQVGHQPAVVTRDGRDKWMAGATAGLAHRLGVASVLQSAAKQRGETLDLDPGEFRGVGFVQLAMEALQRSGAPMQSRDPMAIVGQALTVKAAGSSAIVQGTGDFPILLENLLRKTLQSSFTVTPDTWSAFCGIGSVIDFRTNRRYLRGSFGVLDTLTETGEFANRAIPDGSRESLTATTKGNIIALSRQALVNDDMGAFMALAQDLGRAAKLSIEADVYALLAANPLMSDGFALFATQHGNIGTAAVPTVASFDEVRRLMASQRDVSGNDFLDIRPSHWVGAMSQGGFARTVNGSQYDPTANAGQGRANIALGLFQSINDTPRIPGTLWYGFADKSVAPAIEVGFLNGVQEPFIDSEQGWRMDGIEWKVRLDYGVAAVNWRSAVRNAGA